MATDVPGHSTDWTCLLSRWVESRGKPSSIWRSILDAARRRLATNTSSDWAWLAQALCDDYSKLFIAYVFEHHSVPKRLVSSFIRAAVYETNPSLNRLFVQPCVRTYGAAKVLARLVRYFEEGSTYEKAGAISAAYWCRTLEPVQATGEIPLTDTGRLFDRLQRAALRAFINNDDLDLRRRIMPMLNLRFGTYSTDLEASVMAAISIARGHPDEYIRHRVEVQLGNSRVLYPLPPRRLSED